MNTLDILERLISFPTFSRSSNLELIGYVCFVLDTTGIPWELVKSADGGRANLFATVGPRDRGGVILSGHTDVVPVEGQDWRGDPFTLLSEDGRCYGRGTADMKGFVASAMSAVLRAAHRPLRTPVHLALSCDEEIGCVGVRDLLEHLKTCSPRPVFCLVGEPTGMRIAIGHKGKLALRACCKGRSAHSALAPEALNALHLGADFLGVLRCEQKRLAETGARDAAYEIPYSTIHAGLMQGGQALNIVPDRCEIDFEIRNLVADEPQTILNRILAGAETIAASQRDRFPEVAIQIETMNGYPGLDMPATAAIVDLLRQITHEGDEICKVAFGAEAGLFHEYLGIAAVVCGPGRMAQGHKADEYIEISQLAKCDAMLDRLLDRLEAGL